VTTCELCRPLAVPALFEDDEHRVVLVDDPDYPGFCRVIHRRHVAEMTDLSADEASRLFDLVLRVERGLRRILNPAKVNLASLGNVVPHLHWHVIPRFVDDLTFPRSVWSQASRPRSLRSLPPGFSADLAEYLRAGASA
jgi:diadenosine tetraphosphate (Ap4A) HIT family hydrolase